MCTLEFRLAALTSSVLLLGLAGCQELSEPDLSGAETSLAAAAETETTIEVVPLDFVDGSPCIEELIHWTGTLRLVLHETSNRGAPPPSDPGFQHFIEVQLILLTGTGLDSGDSYGFNSVGVRPVQSPDPVEPFPSVNKYNARGRLIGPGVVVISEFTFTVVTTATGEVVVDRFDISATCH